MLMPARARRVLRATTTPKTGAVQQSASCSAQTSARRSSRAFDNHPSRMRNSRIAACGMRAVRTAAGLRSDRVVISTLPRVLTIEGLSDGVAIDTDRQNESVDIPAALPEHVRPALLDWPRGSKSATRLVAFANDGVVE
jgi:hypothetical protein